MKNYGSRALMVLITLIASFAFASAQGDAIAAAAGDKYVISAKAGGVNHIEGAVGIVRKAGESGRLIKGDRIEVGDRVSTGNSGRAEVLLNPGSYLRLAGNSAFEFNRTSLDDLAVRLDAGTAIFEVFATNDFRVEVAAPRSTFYLVDSGVYRVVVGQDGNAKISVWKGKAQIGDDKESVVKGGREASVNGGTVAIAKFDRDERDDFDTWSRDRAKDLAKTTGKLQREHVRTELMRSFLGRGWNMYSSFGLWVYDPFRSSYCFLPFGFGWNSPYGYGFGQNIWYYNLPPVTQMPPSVGPGNNPPVRVIRDTKPGVIRDSKPVTRTYVHAPFTKVQGTSSSTGRDVVPYKPGRSDGDSYSPVRPSVRYEPVPVPVPATPIMQTKPGRNP